MGKTIKNEHGLPGNSNTSPRTTTISVDKATKEHLARNKSSKQCYDAFINDLVDYWERYRIGSSLCATGRPLHHEGER
jgi:hypothetical protein